MSWAAIQATDSRSTSACSLASSLSASWAAVILALSAIVVSPFVALLEQTDDHEARDGRTHIGHAALLHHDPRLDRSGAPLVWPAGSGWPWHIPGAQRRPQRPWPALRRLDRTPDPV